MVTTDLKRLAGSSGAPSANDPIGAFCAIGNPNSFLTLAGRLGYQGVFQRVFTDHHNYTQADVDALVHAAQRQGAKALLTTAKDAVKLQKFHFGLPCYYVEIKIEIDNEEELRRIVLDAARS
jgi:tetraacyldisaccharide 4'-kinase